MSHSRSSPKHDRFTPLVVREALMILAAFSPVSINHRFSKRQHRGGPSPRHRAQPIEKPKTVARLASIRSRNSRPRSNAREALPLNATGTRTPSL